MLHLNIKNRLISIKNCIWGGKISVKKKIIGIFVCTLLIITIIPSVGSIRVDNYKNLTNSTNPENCIWSGKGEKLYNWAITPPIDLTGANIAELKIQTLYHIENLEDCTVVISTNDGKSWPNPIGHISTGAQSDWKDITYDLSEFSGETILIGFIYTTEIYSTLQGWSISNIVVKAGGSTIYSEDFENYNVGDQWGDWTIIEKPSGGDIPVKPDKPQGPSTGKIGTPITFSAVTTDPDGDKIYYQFYWGDGFYSNWIGPFDSGVTCQAEHTYNKEYEFTVKVKAKDEWGFGHSEWSDPHSISLPRKKQYINPLFKWFLQNYIDMLPLQRLLLRFYI